MKIEVQEFSLYVSHSDRQYVYDRSPTETPTRAEPEEQREELSLQGEAVDVKLALQSG